MTRADLADRLLVIVPAYNEEGALGAVLQDLATLASADVLVVDDGSGDATGAVARAAGVMVASLPYNLGIGGALRTGFKYAERQGYQRAVQFDADGQHLADQVCVLLDALDNGADMVVGTRFGAEESTYHIGRFRSSAMRMLRVLVLLLSGSRLTDTSSGFRAFSRRAIELFAADYPAEYMDSVEALVLAVQAGLSVAETPVTMRGRVAGMASNRTWRLAYHYVRLLVVLLSGVRATRAAGKAVRS